ncbi:histidine phosphatase family protein [Liquorilactobacillus mali]|uniref:Phosphoglycerate mutase n=1 Tax=Liquorilactobacillus mali TaxID=1618 RepID=A0A0R2FS98_9LACO|nr:histidine phosphatase family protein [Liquorilactobacillus mali]KRN31184.1 phosphoglycerate mutase [Liquorilactobacillus mali]MDN7145777.1 histidine phosphatase family protein [Liquorilactobacillus mali]
MSKRIIFIRHGKTEWNVEGRLQGAHGDSPLIYTPEIQSDLKALAAYLKLFSISAVYSSPLKRAYKTASLLSSQISADIQVITDPGLAEISFGFFEGLKKENLLTDYPVEFDLLSSRTDDIRLQKLGVESFLNAQKRFCKSIDDITEKMNGNQTCLVVSHGAISQLGIQRLTNNNNLGGLSNLSLSQVVEQSGHYIIEKYNETAFLTHPVIHQKNTSIK